MWVAADIVLVSTYIHVGNIEIHLVKAINHCMLSKFHLIFVGPFYVAIC
jgi:hypothetical protein